VHEVLHLTLPFMLVNLLAEVYWQTALHDYTVKILRPGASQSAHIVRYSGKWLFNEDLLTI